MNFATCMTPLLAIAWGQTLAGFLMFVVSLFLILLVLVQRGRGGGLSGAFGGSGGQSAFGAKAGDTFTRVTIVAATIWIVLCILSVRFLGGGRVADSVFNTGDDTELTEPATSELESLLGGVDSAADPADEVPDDAATSTTDDGPASASESASPTSPTADASDSTAPSDPSRSEADENK